MKFTKITALVAGAMALGVANHALAGEAGKMYGSLGAGGMQITDIGVNVTESAYGATGTFNGDIAFDAGFAISGAVGRYFTNNIRGELEVGYSKADYDNISGTGTITYNGTTYTATGSDDIDGSASMFTGLANAYYDFDTGSGITPYVGAGLGLVRLKDEVNSVGTLTLDYSDSSTKLAGALHAGFNADMDNGMTAGLSYKFFWADTGTTGVDDAKAHALMAKLNIDF
jgi:OmpA-OmpF porin, OOP family